MAFHISAHPPAISPTTKSLNHQFGLQRQTAKVKNVNFNASKHPSKPGPVVRNVPHANVKALAGRWEGNSAVHQARPEVPTTTP